MRYRKLDANGDYSFGHSVGDFYVDQPEAAGQAGYTRLKLWLGEWFLDTSDGTPYVGSILGKDTAGLYDQAIRARILGTQGIVGGSLQPVIPRLTAYDSNVDSVKRRLSVSATADTIFGAPVPISVQ